MHRRNLLLLLAVACAALLAGCLRSTADVSARATVVPTATEAPTIAPIATVSPTPSATPTPEPSPTPLPPVQLVESYPFDGDVALVAERPLVLVFDRPMNAAAVAGVLTIDPAIEGVVEWPEPSRMVVRPAAPLAEGEYTFRLAAGALGAQGEPLAEPLTLRFGVGGRGVPVPVLMYHAIEELDADASESKRTWTVSPAAFAAQMEYLLANGWTTVSPAALAAYLTDGAPLPSRPLVISMDDGYKEVYTVVYPVLKDTPLRPVLYVPPDHVGLRAYLTMEQLEELAAAGFLIGAHGYDHTDLRGASDADLPHQVGDSKTFFEDQLGITVDSFCFPYGGYDRRTLAALTAHGYTSAMTLNPFLYQTPGDPLRLSRLLVDYGMTIEEFTELLP